MDIQSFALALSHKPDRKETTKATDTVHSVAFVVITYLIFSFPLE